jgi:hypothetical protein
VSSSSTSGSTDQFGLNEWLVEEMYQRLEDPDASTRLGTISSPTPPR